MVSIRVASLMNCAVTSSGLRVPAKGTSAFIRSCVASGSGVAVQGRRPPPHRPMMTPTPPETGDDACPGALRQLAAGEGVGRRRTSRRCCGAERRLYWRSSASKTASEPVSEARVRGGGGSADLGAPDLHQHDRLLGRAGDFERLDQLCRRPGRLPCSRARRWCRGSCASVGEAVGELDVRTGLPMVAQRFRPTAAFAGKREAMARRKSCRNWAATEIVPFSGPRVARWAGDEGGDHAVCRCSSRPCNWGPMMRSPPSAPRSARRR